MVTDYHVHLEKGPYTLEWMEKFLEVAQKRNVTDLGFSEHAYRFKQTKDILFNPWIKERQTEDVEEYINLLLEAKKQGLPVKLGVELDYIPGKEKELEKFIETYPWDYVIGSVHWIDDWGFDLGEMKQNWDDQSIIGTYQKYFEILDHLLAFGKFDILGHIDVIKVFGHKPQEKDLDILLQLYDNIIRSIKKSNITVEMSTAGLRKPVKELYPSPILMEKLSLNEIPMMINSDAHQPVDVGADYDQGMAYLKKHGIHQISTFKNRKRTMKALGKR